jgi:integrase
VDRIENPMPNLTQKLIESLKATDKIQSLPDGAMKGLELYVTKTGVKTFSVRYTLPDGTRRRMTLGRWPVLTLVDAREMTLDILNQVAKGKDPAVAKKVGSAEARANQVKTVRDLGEALIQASTHKGGRPSTLTYWSWLMKKHINPRVGDLRTTDLTSKLLRPVLREIGADAGPVTSNRTLTVLKRMYNFAVDEELLEVSPIAKVKFAFNETSRDRVISESELAAIWRILELSKNPSRNGDPERDGLGVSAAMALAIQLCAFTCQRGSEVVGIRWGEIDLDGRVWVLPAARSKSKRENLVPLSDGAMAVVKDAVKLAEARYGRQLRSTDALFPSPRARRTGEGVSSDVDIPPVERLSLNRAMARVTSAAEVTNATVHDLRRTGATIMASEKIGTLNEIVSRVLNHSASAYAVTGIYNRYGYVAEKRAALQAWSEVITQLGKGSDGHRNG